MHPPLVTREGALCQRCSDLDLQALFDSVLSSATERYKEFEFDFSTDVSDSSLTCPLCNLTQRLVPEHEDVFHLFGGDILSTGKVFMEIKKSHSGQTKLLCCCDGRFKRRPRVYDWPKDPKRVDFGPLKQKFAQCKAEHGTTCGVKSRTPVEGLQVYNCLTNKLEEATTHTNYIALSYVWGPDPENSFQKPPEQRRTICDAMQVAIRLGYKYIWVDQLCINQGGTHKLQQIQQMNRIYQNADLTIVAAAGDNADFGIPGVQDRSRLDQGCFKFGDLQFVETLRHPIGLLERTTWSSRAWTFQEEKLSHRLLVFTERAAWFSCYITPAVEGFETDIRDRDEDRTRDIGLALARKTPRPTCGLRMPISFDELIIDYSHRFLTYPSDAVNAFSGILTALKEAKLIVSHVWGTPIMPPIVRNGHVDRFDPGPGAVRIKTNAVDGFIIGLMWKRFNLGALKPRHGIPSWSWAGWQGRIGFVNLYKEEDVNFGVEAYIELEDGQVLAWPEFEGLSYLENQPHLISRFIRLKAWTMDVRFEYHEFPSGPRMYVDTTKNPKTWAVVQMLNGDELLSQAFILGEPDNPSTKEPLGESKCKVYTGLCLFPIEDTTRSRRYVMLLHKVNGSFQRLGYFELDMFDRLRQTGPSGEVTYYDRDHYDRTNKMDVFNHRVLRLNARMEEIRIG